MAGILSSLTAGFPILIAHFLLTIGLLVLAVMVYIRITAHDELQLVRDGNNAAALSLAGAILGLAIPLASCLAASVSLLDILVWGVITLLLQLLVFWAMDRTVRNLSRRIEEGEIGPAILLVAVKLSVAAVSAAAVSG
ncbi:DUF350 domain-containing protein [Nisaea sp.]|uniref:DUF350 domain-containing protein n=1 Tax=Nisaea sp. TaxID=2024842 RepID=UPI0025CEE3DF|nr:DUF350 domain-containing protein [Nisaea sp.]